MNLKVQFPNRKPTTAALVNSGFANEGKSITFHAFSDTMKARVLEMIARGEKVVVSFTDEKPKIGEWMEEIKP